MNLFSKTCLTIFEVVNELYIAVGAGVIGMAVLIQHGYKTNQLLRTLSVASLSLASLIYVFQTSSERKQPTNKQIIFISGCDSGLGYSLALHCADLGFTVIAGFLSLDSQGAKDIKKHKCSCGCTIKQIELDVTNTNSVFVAVETIKQYLNSNTSYELYAVVNNAAVMVFGEFEWQTEKLIQQQLDVNLYGTLRLSKAFIPLLRKYRGRLINITSHCSQESLPGLAVYGATKAGVKGFSDALRVELAKYGVKVITFIPGSFVSQSNILVQHANNVHEMHRAFNEEQHAFYEDYFQRYNAHLLGLNLPKAPKMLDDKRLYIEFDEALLSVMPKSAYKVEQCRYTIYHFIFKYSPSVAIRDYFVVKFMAMPEYNMNQTW